MAVAWDSRVNQTILDEGYSKAIMTNVITTEAETGPKISRRRSKSGRTQHTIKLRLNRTFIIDVANNLSELDIFEYFMRDVLMDGALTTYFPVPNRFISKEVRIVGDSPYKITGYKGDYAYVQFTLEEII